MADKSLVDIQRRRNADSVASWTCGASHRERITQLLTSASPGTHARLCVLGAGNCNDLDLPRLVERFGEVHLVDVDDEALQAAVKRQQIGDDSRLHLHGDCELTGVWDSLSAWSPDQLVEEEELERTLKQAADFRGPDLPGAFDVVASVCLLSQLFEAIVSRLGEGHPRFVEFVQVVRRRHVQLLVELTAPGGTGVLVSDVVSTATAPELVDVPAGKLASAMAQLARDGNFFHGTNPRSLAEAFRSDPTIAPKVESYECLPPWMWDFGVRQYAVAGIRFHRR